MSNVWQLQGGLHVGGLYKSSPPHPERNVHNHTNHGYTPCLLILDAVYHDLCCSTYQAVAVADSHLQRNTNQPKLQLLLLLLLVLMRQGA